MIDDIHETLPRLLGFYDFQHSGTVIACHSADPFETHLTAIHEQTHKDDVFNTIYGRHLRTLISRRNRASSDADMSDNASQLIHRAWFTLEGSATYQQYCASSFRGISHVESFIASLPNDYSLALGLFSAALRKLVAIEGMPDLFKGVHALQAYSALGSALAEVVLDSPIYIHEGQINSSTELLEVFRGAAAPDDLLQVLAVHTRQPVQLPDPPSCFDQSENAWTLLQHRAFVESLKIRIATGIHGALNRTIDDQNMLILARRLSLEDSPPSGSLTPVQSHSYILRFDYSDNQVTAIDRPTNDSFADVLKIASGATESRPTIMVVNADIDGWSICCQQIVISEDALTNGATAKSTLDSDELTQILQSAKNESIVILPVTAFERSLVSMADLRKSRALTVVVLSEFNPDMMQSLLCETGSAALTVYKITASPAAEIVLIDSMSPRLAFPCLVGEVEQWADSLGGTVRAAEIASLQWLALYQVKVLIGNPAPG